MVAIYVDNWCCGNCKLREQCKRISRAIACKLIHDNYKDKGYILDCLREETEEKQ